MCVCVCVCFSPLPPATVPYDDATIGSGQLQAARGMCGTVVARPHFRAHGSADVRLRPRVRLPRAGDGGGRCARETPAAACYGPRGAAYRRCLVRGGDRGSIACARACGLAALYREAEQVCAGGAPNNRVRGGAGPFPRVLRGSARGRWRHCGAKESRLDKRRDRPTQRRRELRATPPERSSPRSSIAARTPHRRYEPRHLRESQRLRRALCTMRRAPALALARMTTQHSHACERC